VVWDKTDRLEMLQKYFLKTKKINQKPYPMVLANMAWMQVLNCFSLSAVGVRYTLPVSGAMSICQILQLALSLRLMLVFE
jgi:hypothetical protein